MSDTFRVKKYNCKDSVFHMQEVNCTSWSVNVESCKTSCSLNLFENPTIHNCIACKQRTGYSKEILEEDKKIIPVTIKNTEPKITPKNIASYANAELSQFIQGKVDDEIYNERKEKCMGCPSRVNNVNNKTDEIGWCNSCGCGLGNDNSKLSIKLRKPSLFCPRGKFQPAMGAGFNISDAVDSITGAFKVVKKAIE